MGSFKNLWFSLKGSPRTHSHSTNRDLASCDIFNGNWVLDDAVPIYRPGSCPYLDDAFNCFKNGRPDFDYLKYRWKPHGCQILILGENVTARESL
ncbi:hypothetical protein L6164_013630 [Bauhinia variegata]|uniref:Uncharacterized protein n=1 Tax=Bauhinia variegata TaxID=167791 RepID=A0ACB9NG17_BAUVA|nr:hypothetical protein L6164_013630 [Bauhinia variegata]